ncbi:TOMM precursor leader peptide-binding protein [Streptomyces sp. NPDC004296]|uniref:TOMM precursor leader peptide-binding protein n=1 Tax=Streptomyces sp. NPDC004296 TaxID=3364697 RepID=UPI003675B6C3
MLTAADGPRVGFKRHLRTDIVAGEAVYLRSEQGVTALRSPHMAELARLLDGTRTLPDLLREASAAMPALEAGRVIGRLARSGLVGYRDPAAEETCDAAALAYWDLLGLHGDTAGRGVAGTPVALLALGRADLGAARAACLASGLTLVAPGAEQCAGLSLVLCDDYLHPGLRGIDAAHRLAGRPWLLAKPCGPNPWVGPVFGAPDGPCWSCLAHRLRGHRAAEVPVQRALGCAGPVAVPEASLAAGRAMALHTAALEAAKWLAGVRTDGQHAVCALDTLTLRTDHHRVTRRPQCPDCGDPGLLGARLRRPLALTSRPKVDGGGNHRALRPEEVLDRHRHLIGPVTGIVAENRPDERTPDGINCYVSGHNLALTGRSLAGVRSSLRSRSGGKGVTRVEAEVSALCEAVERYSGTRQGDEPTVRDTLTGLGAAALHPNDCQLFDARQFRDRTRWNARHSAFQQVCPPFDPDRPTEWTPVWSVTGRTHRLLPTSMLYYSPHCVDAPPDLPWADSNGNAAGASLEDAVVQGFLELVERDAVALWWYNRTRQPAVDLGAFDEPWISALTEVYGRLHRRVWVLDLTSDLGIPVMAALSRRSDGPAEEIAFGFGAHFDPRLALRRALTEMGQLLPTVVDAPVPGSTPSATERELRAWWSGATTAGQPYLLPDPAQTPRTPGGYGYTPRPDLRDDLDAIEDLVRAHGMELLVLDQTRPDIGLPVVKVLVPGLRHFWARFAPGRLFDVPAALGRTERPTAYARLNPVPMFI